MKILQKPVSEGEVLHSVMIDTPSAEVLDSLHQKAECCVDHLCGCSSVPLPGVIDGSKSATKFRQQP
jgi:hypothetical protein